MTKRIHDTSEFTKIAEREMRDLNYLAGCLRAAQRDLASIRETDYPADVYPEVLASFRAEVADAQRDFDFEWQALEALQELRAAAPAPRKTEKPRCAHYKLIQRFFAIARDAGLDTSKAAKPKMRHAMESLMGRCVDSRSEVTATEWQIMGDAIKAGVLAW